MLQLLMRQSAVLRLQRLLNAHLQAQHNVQSSTHFAYHSVLESYGTIWSNPDGILGDRPPPSNLPLRLRYFGFQSPAAQSGPADERSTRGKVWHAPTCSVLFRHALHILLLLKFTNSLQSQEAQCGVH